RSVGYEYNNGYGIKDDFCIDASAGTAVDYAKENGIRLKSGTIRGDVNADGEFNVADAVVLQKWMLGVSDTKIADWQAGNLHDDNILDVFDLCLMKKELTLQNK
ncbi:MAG: dockerin type I repeat-containing protein, partial [Ruminococcus sp.]|nr:dockerin type I repeat-containing protein [Ruminococcus sp.]